ncbi:OLC1v1013289C1 [Oldenlandia corymbosa var. corymbosa]|uniref:OLC1v1013289C1 n=1 Tax=Oldenlandia corymbosa var. corymbosa TaxID=529605 RepID=A0AAV1DY70_OLDCO|nr:OLC1v1013289C1 [Oldenlandia corymbosa var. corymbosa]
MEQLTEAEVGLRGLRVEVFGKGENAIPLSSWMKQAEEDVAHISRELEQEQAELNRARVGTLGEAIVQAEELVDYHMETKKELRPTNSGAPKSGVNKFGKQSFSAAKSGGDRAPGQSTGGSSGQGSSCGSLGGQNGGWKASSSAQDYAEFQQGETLWRRRRLKKRKIREKTRWRLILLLCHESSGEGTGKAFLGEHRVDRAITRLQAEKHGLANKKGVSRAVEALMDNLGGEEIEYIQPVERMGLVLTTGKVKAINSVAQTIIGVIKNCKVKAGFVCGPNGVPHGEDG